MKYVAKNMDSVFADCTDSELSFETMFDEDDSLIDLVAGVDESGEYITGPNPEDNYQFQLDEDGNMIEDKDDKAQRDGTAKENLPKEGEAGNPNSKLGDSGEQGSANLNDGNSAESKAHDVTPGIKDAIGESSNNSEGPLKDDDEAERKGEKKVDECDKGKSLAEAIVAKVLEGREELANVIKQIIQIKILLSCLMQINRSRRN